MGKLRWLPIVCLLASTLVTGCASITNPVADGIPVRRLPEEVLGRSKNDLKPIPLTSLRLKEPDAYRLDKGDTLAVVADEILTRPDVLPPIRLADANNDLSAVGVPVVVDEDGMITIPRIKPIKVTGMTVGEVQKAIIDEATGKNGGKQLYDPTNVPRVSVQLMKRRSYKITVERQDTQPLESVNSVRGGAILGSILKGNSFTLRLDAGENVVLHALNATGGLPGLDAKNEVIIERGVYDPNNPEKHITRIPLRIYPEDQLNICEEDITLRDGDVVRIAARETEGEVYYTVGVAASRQFVLPRDYDLDVLQALTIAGAPIANGAFSQNAFVAQSVSPGLGQPSPSHVTVLRQLGNGRQIPIRVDINHALREPRERLRILGGDIIVLQERPGEAIGRYMTQTIRFNTAAETIRSGSVIQNAVSNNP